MYQNILSHQEAGILTITINRESKLNALNIDTLREIKEAVIAGNADAQVHGIVITGAGPKAFAAGADISEFVNFNVEQATKMSADGHSTMDTIEQSGKPVMETVSLRRLLEHYY